MTVGEIDATCNPGGWEYALYGTFSIGGSLDAAGKLPRLDSARTTTSGSTGTLVVDITADTTGKATGALALTMTVGGTGGPYACTSGGGVTSPPAPVRPRRLRRSTPSRATTSGTTAQGAAFVFDVAASGTVLLMNNLTFPELDEDCDPGQVPIAIKNFHFGSNFLVDAAGHLRTSTRRGRRLHGDVRDPRPIDANGQASGTINDKAAFPYGGTNWSCASGSVGWTASLQ